MNNANTEIKRIEEAIAKTKSPKLKRDYEKHLKKLKKLRWLNGQAEN